MKSWILLAGMILSGGLFAQQDSLLQLRERQLVVYLNDLRAASTNADKDKKNKILKEYLFETIQASNAMNYPFSALTSMGTIKSSDNKLRLFNWNVEQDDHTQKYYCYILHFDDRKKETLVSELIDNSFMLPPRPDGILDAKNWYGALYYQIVPIKKGNKEMYTLLGLDANNSMSNIKLLDVLYFTGVNPKLGSPIFKTKTETLKRVFYEHSKKAYMSLKYEEEHKRIIFDHLSPETPSMTGFYSYYVPDFSYDAFSLVKDKWVLQEDVIGVNSKGSGKVKMYVQNEKTGKVEEVVVKEKWINPSNPNAAVGDISHVAVTPDGIPSEKGKKEKRFLGFTKKEKKYKQDTYSTYPYSEVNRKRKRDGGKK